MSIAELATRARQAAVDLAAADTELKNTALARIEEMLGRESERILAANRRDVECAEAEGLAAPLLKRLKFDDRKLAAVRKGVRSLIALPDPVGVVQSAMELDAGLDLQRVSCPIGVIGIIFESRPDALVQISTLCLKSGNAALLKGGSEAAETNRELAQVIVAAAREAGLPDGWLQLLETRAEVGEMLKLDEDIDLIIPRGSNEFVRHIMQHSNIPVLGHADGVCHVYVDANADINMALAIIEDAKCQYPAVCNAAETLLVHRDTAAELLPKLKSRLDARGCELRGCEQTLAVIEAAAATEADWGREYLDLILAVRVVDDLDAAVEHINRYGSGHTDAIVTADRAAAERFMARVDSGNVFWNCSTRFSDGYRYGLGAEVGISTNKIHARGPVGLDGLLSYKWQLRGTGQVVAPYAEGSRRFTHRRPG
jgi:glutamate-5-semialdehyde dehydrogenase